MAGIIKQTSQGHDFRLLRTAVDDDGAVFVIGNTEGVEFTVYLSPSELERLIAERYRFKREQHKDGKLH